MFVDHHETIGLGERERPQQRRVGEREEGAVGADAERQRDRRDDREARRPSQLPDRKPDIVSKFVEPLDEAHLTISLSAKIDASPFQPLDVAEAAGGHLASGLGVHPAGNQIARVHLEMEDDLLVHLLLERHGPQPRTQ